MQYKHEPPTRLFLHFPLFTQMMENIKVLAWTDFSTKVADAQPIHSPKAYKPI